MLPTGHRARFLIKRIFAIALPVVGRQIRTIRVHGAILVVLLGLVVSGFSQTTVSTGGIQGTVTDPSGALVTGAIVSITNTAPGQTASVNTNSAGSRYRVHLEGDIFSANGRPNKADADAAPQGPNFSHPASADKVKALSTHHRSVIALHSPDRFAEPECAYAVQRKMAENLAVGSDKTLSPVPFGGKTYGIAAIFRRD